MQKSLTASLLLPLLILAACGGAQGLSTATESENKGVVHRSSQADRDALESKHAIESDAALLYVNGLGCPLCATNIDKQLLRARSVASADVDLGAGTVLIRFKPDAAHASPLQLKNIVADAGFTLVKVESR